MSQTWYLPGGVLSIGYINNLVTDLDLCKVAIGNDDCFIDLDCSKRFVLFSMIIIKSKNIDYNRKERFF